jgi:hypothetical protein
MTSKFRVFFSGLLLAVNACTALAHGPHGGYRGGYYRGDYFWGPALVGTAVVGTSIYLSRPVQPSTVIITSPPTVIVNTPPPTTWTTSQPVQAPAEAYYCRDTGQYFPLVQTCPTPWWVVNPR